MTTPRLSDDADSSPDPSLTGSVTDPAALGAEDTN